MGSPKGLADGVPVVCENFQEVACCGYCVRGLSEASAFNICRRDIQGQSSLLFPETGNPHISSSSSVISPGDAVIVSDSLSLIVFAEQAISEVFLNRMHSLIVR
jgi:hypothetical protein